jgi:cation transport regulator
MVMCCLVWLLFIIIAIKTRERHGVSEFIYMPYNSINELPDSVKSNLPKRGQVIYRKAFNSAFEQYGEEDRAHRVAWSAVENKYEKNEKGNWVKRNA